MTRARVTETEVEAFKNRYFELCRVEKTLAQDNICQKPHFSEILAKDKGQGKQNKQ